MNVGIPQGSLQYTGDRPATFEDIGSSGQPVHRRFCNKCGLPIVSEVDPVTTRVTKVKLHGRVIAAPHMEVPMTSDVRVFLGTLAVS